MDVSFADHSHIIGKGGNTIKKGKNPNLNIPISIEIYYLSLFLKTGLALNSSDVFLFKVVGIV